VVISRQQSASALAIARSWRCIAAAAARVARQIASNGSIERRSDGRLSSASSTSTAKRPPAPLPRTRPKVSSSPRMVFCKVRRWATKVSRAFNMARTSCAA
jgi:hypothetical protein